MNKVGSLCCRCSQVWYQLTMTSKPKGSRTRALNTELARMASTWSNQVFWHHQDPFQKDLQQRCPPATRLGQCDRHEPLSHQNFQGILLPGLFVRVGSLCLCFRHTFPWKSVQIRLTTPHQSAFSSPAPRETSRGGAGERADETDADET